MMSYVSELVLVWYIYIYIFFLVKCHIIISIVFFNVFLVVYFICLCQICMCIACMNNTVYFFLLFVLVWDCWTVHETWNKSNIVGNPVLLDMMLLDSIQMWNMSYSHLMCYSNNIQLVIAISHSMVEFDQIVKNSIHLNKWILNWNKILKLSSIWYITCNSCKFFFQ